MIADTLAQILGICGYHADSVHSSSEAIERASTNPFDLLVTEVAMEGEISGIDAAIEIYKTLPHCKVLLISGDERTEELLSNAHSMGYDFEILTKPAKPELIMERLKALVAYSGR